MTAGVGGTSMWKGGGAPKGGGLAAGQLGGIGTGGGVAYRKASARGGRNHEGQLGSRSVLRGREAGVKYEPANPTNLLSERSLHPADLLRFCRRFTNRPLKHENRDRRTVSHHKSNPALWNVRETNGVEHLSSVQAPGRYRIYIHVYTYRLLPKPDYWIRPSV